jgi:virulence factor Mce-like protein
MTKRLQARRLVALVGCAALLLSGCSWGGVNSLPLPGAPGRVPGATTFHVEIANVGSLESNSPVLIDDVTVGSVGAMTVHRWHADVEVFVKPGITVPANAVATIGQTSLLGSSHLALNPPIGQAPTGRLEPGATIGLNNSSTYPTTEQTLASLSAVANAGGLGQLGDIIKNFNAAFGGHQDAIRDMITRLDTFVGTFNRQRDNLIATIKTLNRLGGTFAEQRDLITKALRNVPPALAVLVRERDQITTALDKLRVFSDTATGVVNDVQADLVTDLHHLEPTLRALADVGPQIGQAIEFTTVFPYGQKAVDRSVKGDYINLSATVDLTIPRLKREIFMGTRWGDPTQEIQAAIGDPGYAEQQRDPLGILAPPPGNIPLPVPRVPPPPLPGPNPPAATPSPPSPAAQDGGGR